LYFKKSIKRTSSALKRANSLGVLELLYKIGVGTRTKLARELNASLPTISRVIEPYLGDLVFIKGKDNSTGGRKPERVFFNYSARKIGGVQVDKDFFILSVSNLNKIPIVSEKVQFDCTNPHSLSQAIHKKLSSYVKKGKLDKKSLEVLTIAVAGTVSAKEEPVAVDPPLSWRRISNENFFSDEFHKDFPNCSVLFENDANALAVGEYADKGYDEENLVCIYLSSGIGMGIIINGRLYRGSQGRAGEIGKLVPFFGDKIDTFEDYFGRCKRLKKADAMIRLLNNLSLLFNPSEIVLSGSIDGIYREIEKLEKSLSQSQGTNIKYRMSKHGEFAIINGALTISAKEFLREKVYGYSKPNYLLEL